MKLSIRERRALLQLSAMLRDAKPTPGCPELVPLDAVDVRALRLALANALHPKPTTIES